MAGIFNKCIKSRAKGHYKKKERNFSFETALGGNDMNCSGIFDPHTRNLYNWSNLCRQK